MLTNQLKSIFVIVLCCLALSSHASTLQDISFAELPGERAEIRLVFDQMPQEPQGYSIEKPARIVLDFAGVENSLSQKKFPMGVGAVTESIVVAGGGRTRLIVNLDTPTPYSTRFEGADIILTVGAETRDTNVQTPTINDPVNVIETTSPQPSRSRSPAITNLDFRRGEAGEGKVIVSLTNPNINIDVEEVGEGIRVRFLDTNIPAALIRKLDVIDFATPVTTLTTRTEAGDAAVVVAITGEYDYLAYQADDEYVISVKPLTEQEQEERSRKFEYVGERLSLNFQDIPVRNVLQLIADFTDLNLVASDTVSGSITLRLENVPWDQALDIVLKTKGLDKRQIGNVLMVAPASEIAERERQELETLKQLEELAPLRTEYIRIRYANARELFDLFVGPRGGAGGAAGGAAGGSAGGTGDRKSTGSILSERGQAIVDERTNSIILTDTEDKISQFKALVERIDIPIRQVMIEARIVLASNNFREELGIQLDGSFDGDDPDLDVTGQTFTGSGSTGILDFDFIDGDIELGLTLTALETSGFSETVSQPKVITGDKTTASILTGSEVGFQEESASGGTTTSFKEAVLELEVTPQITPDDRVIMDLTISQDSLGPETSSGEPTINVTQLETQVLVNDGETIVLGGIYQTDTETGTSKVPFLGDIPGLGLLFRSDFEDEQKTELLIFITPRIMASNLIE